MNIDKLNSVRPREVLQVAFHVLDTLQNHPPHLQVIAPVLIIKEMSELLQISPSELLDKAERIAGDLFDNYTPEILALREYIRQELRENQI